MLYDPKWEVQTKPDTLSLRGLVAWLETMPSAASYDWENCKGGCLIGIYGAAIGQDEKWHDFHFELFDKDQLHIASNQPWTFGAALKRARAAL